jgi:hypothetical protein
MRTIAFVGCLLSLSCTPHIQKTVPTASNAGLARATRSPSALSFAIQDGKTDNRFFRDGKVAAHLLVTSGDDARLVIAFPAGNMGIGLWFDGPAPSASVTGEVSGIDRTDGLRGVTATVKLKKGLRVKAAILGSVRALRDYGHDGKVPPELKNEIVKEAQGWVTLRRTTLDGAHHLSFTVDHAQPGPDGALTLTDDSITFTALNDDDPLTPITTDAILTGDASDDKRARDALTFLTYEQKVLAGSWQYLTYFGRDTLLSTRLLMPVLKPAVVEAVLGAVIERMSADGEVAHEEDIGEWAVAENMKKSPRPSNLRQPAYDYKMVDDDFMIAPVLAAYLDTDEGKARAAAFFERKTSSGGTYAEALRKNLDRVMVQASPFATKPTHENLIHIGDGLSVGNWRDSNEGLGGGRVPYDINAALVPAALRAAERLWPMKAFGEDAARAKKAGDLAKAWTKAEPLFTVRLDAGEAQKRLAAYTSEEKIDTKDTVKAPVSFPALSLDAKGKPIPIQHTDDGFVLMFTEPSTEWLASAAARIVSPFPVGLRTPVGIVVANPVFVTDPALRKTFTRDHYHGTVVWSWQQAMLLAGVRRQLSRADISPKARHELDKAEGALVAVIEATRPQRTSELWSFSTDAQGYHVVPFGQSAGHHSEANAVQLWSTVYLALDKKAAQ